MQTPLAQDDVCPQRTLYMLLGKITNLASIVIASRQHVLHETRVCS